MLWLLRYSAYAILIGALVTGATIYREQLGLCVSC